MLLTKKKLLTLSTIKRMASDAFGSVLTENILPPEIELEMYEFMTFNLWMSCAKSRLTMLKSCVWNIAVLCLWGKLGLLYVKEGKNGDYLVLLC